MLHILFICVKNKKTTTEKEDQEQNKHIHPHFQPYNDSGDRTQNRKLKVTLTKIKREKQK